MDAELDDRAVHLLFAANRWEKAAEIRQLLSQGKTIVCDRYSFSGIAYTSAKPTGPGFKWCLEPEVCAQPSPRRLPAPALVPFVVAE